MNETVINAELRETLNQSADEYRAILLDGGWWHSIDLGNGIVTPGVHQLEELRGNYARFNLPEDLTGLRVLDIGCWDGFYSFESERRGAEVVAVDCWRPETFFYAHRALQSRVEFHEMSVYEITREQFGEFDIVLFLGVLYHLQHPLLALQRVCELSRDIAVIESYVIDNIISLPHPVAEFYEMNELAGQYDNWWGPNTECLVRMARAAGFVHTETVHQDPTRAAIKAFRRWEPQQFVESPSLRIREVVNAVMLDHRLVRRGRFAQLSIWVEGLPSNVGIEQLKVEVGGYGAIPIYLEPPFTGRTVDRPRLNRLTPPGLMIDEQLRQLAQECMQIIVPVPPGLTPGPTSVRVRHDQFSSRDFEIILIENGPW